jgi:ribonuclease Z
LKLTVLGVGSASPQIDKNPSSFLLSIENEHILIDCGEGTQYRLMENKIKRSRIHTICISHLHGDHYFGLVGLLSSYSLNKRLDPITLIGPKGLKELLYLSFELANTKLSYELEFIETQNQEERIVLDRPKFKIVSFPLIHRVSCTGFLIIQKKGPNHIIRENLPDNFPIPYFDELKRGNDVTDSFTGKTYKALDYTRGGDAEKRFAYCSDTGYNPAMLETIKNANLMYHEATFGNELLDRANMTQHSTAEQAGQIAAKANVSKMLIGHFSSRYKEYDWLLEEARIEFKNTEIAIQNKVYDI